MEEEREKRIVEEQKYWMEKIHEIEEGKNSKAEGPTPEILAPTPGTQSTPHTVGYGSDKASTNAVKKTLILNKVEENIEENVEKEIKKKNAEQQVDKKDTQMIDVDDDCVHLESGQDKKIVLKKVKGEKQHRMKGIVLNLQTMPTPLKLLCMYAQNVMNEGLTINFEIEADVFRAARRTYILYEDITQFGGMVEISANCIVVYMRYLYNVVKRSKMVNMVGFVDPALTGAIGCGTVTERTRHLADRFATSSNDKIFLVPYNFRNHWMLTVINSDKDIVYFMDPMRRRLIGDEWKTVVDKAFLNNQVTRSVVILLCAL